MYQGLRDLSRLVRHMYPSSTANFLSFLEGSFSRTIRSLYKTRKVPSEISAGLLHFRIFLLYHRTNTMLFERCRAVAPLVQSKRTMFTACSLALMLEKQYAHLQLAGFFTNRFETSKANHLKWFPEMNRCASSSRQRLE